MAIDWQNLVFLESDFVYLRGVFRERKQPLSLQALLSDFVEYRMHAGDESSGVIAYHPYDTYMIGQTVYFPAHDEREVIREIEPCVFLGEKCSTIVYRSKRDKTVRTFIAGATEYFEGLSHPPPPEGEATSVEEIIERYGLAIRARLGAILASNRNFCRFRDWWLLRELALEVDVRTAYNYVYEYGCIDSHTLAVSVLGDLDLSKGEDQLKLFSLCFKLGSDRRLLYDPILDLWRLPRLYGIQKRSIGRTDDEHKVELHPAPIYPDTPSARKQINNLEDGDMWSFTDFAEEDRNLLASFGEDMYEAVEQEYEDWAAQRPKSVTFRLSTANVLNGFLSLHPDARKLFPERAKKAVLADDFGVRFDVVIDIANRILYNSDGLLVDYFAAHSLESGCEVHVEHLDSETNYHVFFKKEAAEKVPTVVVGYDESSRTAMYHYEEAEPACQAKSIFRVKLSPDDMVALREAAYLQQKNTFDLICEELPRLAQVVPEGTVTAEQLFDAVYVRRPCQLTVLLGDLCRHPCFNRHEVGGWTMVADGSIEPLPPTLQWEPTMPTSSRRHSEETEEAVAEAEPAPTAEETEALPAATETAQEPAPETVVQPKAKPELKEKPKPKRDVHVPDWVGTELRAEIERFVLNHRKSEDIDPSECLDPDIFDEFYVEAYASRRHQRYATPREVVKFMVEMADPRIGQRIIDPGCGTGSFVLATLQCLKKQLEPGLAIARDSMRLLEIPPIEGETEPRHALAVDEDEVRHAFNAVCSPNVAGIDLEPMAVEGTTLNLALHGFSGAQLLVYDAMASQDIVPTPIFDVVLGNPPPGEYWEEAFYSRYWELAKPGGRIVTLIHNSVLLGPDRSELRNWFTSYFVVEALVTLPKPKKKDLYGEQLHVVSLRKPVEGEEFGETLVARAEKYSQLQTIAEAFHAQGVEPASA